MRLLETIAEFKAWRRQLEGTLGFVPTMGCLHEGHLVLVHRAAAENDAVAASIFVNPLQFGPREDFREYPRDLPRDLALLEKAEVAAVFHPSPEEMYPAGYSTYIQVEKVSEPLEGAVRPGHFKGVATVVAKLFNIVEPSRAYFGQKDAQQVAVLKMMVADLNLNLELIAVPTVREPDGLAMSSRNIYLNPEERRAALVLYRALRLAQELWGNGERDAERLRRQLTAIIQQEPLARIDYVSVAHPDTMQELAEAGPGALFSLAVRIGRTRLIDNTVLGNWTEMDVTY